jgi:hypothetical protein
MEIDQGKVMFRSVSFIATAICLLLSQVLAMAHGHDADSVCGTCHGAHVHLFFTDCHAHDDECDHHAEGMAGSALPPDAEVLGIPGDHDDDALFLHPGALIRTVDDGHHAKLVGHGWALSKLPPRQIAGNAASSGPDRGPALGGLFRPCKCPIYILNKSILI